MKKLSKCVLLIGIILFSNTLLADKYIHQTNDRLHIILRTDNTYEIDYSLVNHLNEFYGPHIITKGVYTFIGDTLILECDTAIYRLMVIDSERLQSIDNIGSYVLPGDYFFCDVKYYSDGGIEYIGSWENRKKHGKWVYYDSLGFQGDPVGLIYNEGKVVDTFEVDISVEY